MTISILKDVDREYLQQERILGFVEFLFKKFGVNNDLEFNILFSDDNRIAQLNRQFKDKDEPTDILSFYGYDGDILGDVIISVETVEKEADDRNIDDYVLFLIAHGFLHLLGYTHETLEKYDDMIYKQNKLIEEWKNEKT